MDQIIKLLAVASACYPNFQGNKDTFKVYAELLADINIVILEKAIKICIMSCRFFPTVAEIREEAARIESPYMPTAMEAWSLVMNEVNRVHFYGIPEFDNKVIIRLVTSIGWRNICLTTEPDILRSQFLKAYDSLAIQHRTDSKLPDSMRYYPNALENKLVLTDGVWDTEEQAYILNNWKNEEWRMQLFLEGS